MKKTKILTFTALGMALAVTACSGKSGAANAQTVAADSAEVTVAFDADSAYSYVKAQVDFGPRVPGSAAHAACVDWLTAKLKSVGADQVTVQEGTMTQIDGSKKAIKNVVARINPGATDRTLLVAHFDTRPWADNDADTANHTKPIDGANDGASGVGVILEIVRQLKLNGSKAGVDVLFADFEDSGLSAPDDADAETQARYDKSWCLGTQYFVENMPFDGGTTPRRAILLDMVGGRDAVFMHEYFGLSAAPQLARDIWQAAVRAGYGKRFVDRVGGAVNDDHVPLIEAGIPAIDIIEISHPQTGSFNPTWHTLNDNLGNIDPGTLRAVGAAILTYLNR